MLLKKDYILLRGYLENNESLTSKSIQKWCAIWSTVVYLLVDIYSIQMRPEGIIRRQLIDVIMVIWILSHVFLGRSNKPQGS